MSSYCHTKPTPPNAPKAQLSTMKDNPKRAQGSNKVPMHEMPPVADAHISCAFYDGDLKYGFRNWRTLEIDAATYIAAALRHIHAWAECEEVAPDSGVHHLGHAGACIALLLDAQANGRLIDNRVAGAFPKVLTELAAWVEQRNKKAAEAAKK